MKSSLILGVALLLTIVSIVQARKIGCPSCGSLGSGTNPCKCGDVVVKAARVQKPLYYASPEAINEAVAAREVLSVRSGNPLFPGYQASGVYDISGGVRSSTSSAGFRSSTVSSDISGTSASLGGLVGGSGVYPVTNKLASGCGAKHNIPLEVNDLLSPSTRGKVVPSFQPIGDLCYPSKFTKHNVITKVTPAYLGKLRFRIPSVPVCRNVIGEQINESELSRLGVANQHSSAINRLGVFTGSAGGRVSDSFGVSDSYGGYVAAGGALQGYNGKVGQYETLSRVNEYDRTSNLYGLGAGVASGFGEYDGSYAVSAAGTNVYEGSSRGVSAGSLVSSGAGSLGQFATDSISGYGVSNNLGTYGALSEKAGRIQGSFERDRYDFGDEIEYIEDYSYPRKPADAVSLTLAYKNLFPQTVVQNRRWFVPEDKLAFGHRTVPSELVLSKEQTDVPEERLQILDKPIVELKPATPIAIGVYDEREETGLAELEVIEREKINEEAIAERPQANLITYGDLGYAPIDGIIVPGKFAGSGTLQIDSTVGAIDAEDVIIGGNYPAAGPFVPDYVPGAIVIDRETIEVDDESEDVEAEREFERSYSRQYFEDESDEDEETYSTTSGIFTRLKNVARRTRPIGSCPQ